MNSMKKAVIVGATSGIGLQVARLLLKEGWSLGLAGRRVELLHDLSASAKGQVVTCQLDVTAEDAPLRLMQLVESLGGMDLYFHAAGIGKQNPELEPSVEMATMATNGMGFTRMVDAAFQWMAAHGGGHIAVISSIAGTKGLGPAPSYSATKAFQSTYLQALEQLANSRRLPIAFTDIRPGFVDTDLLRGSRFPMMMPPDRVARQIVKSLHRRRHVVVIDWRYRILVFLWRLIPNFIWRRLRFSHH